jgi:HEAT repeat protein
MALFGPPNLSKLEAKRDTPGLVKALQYEKDSQVPRAAAAALGRIGDPQAIEPLVDAHRHSREAKHGINVRHGSEIRDAVERALVQFGELAVEPMICALGDADPSIRELAVGTLGQIGDARAVDALARALADWAPPTRAKAAEALGTIGDPRAVDSLARALADPKAEAFVLAAAVRALRAIGDARAIESLVAGYRYRTEYTRNVIDTALVPFGARAVAPLISALSEDDPLVRAHVAGVLARIGDARAIEPLALALKDPDQVMRTGAATALGKLGWAPEGAGGQSAYLVATEAWDACAELGASCVDPLIGALRDPDRGVRRCATEALTTIGEDAVEALVGALSGEVYQREAAAAALGRIGGVRAVEGLVGALGRTPPAPEALAGLEQLGKDALEPLAAALPHLASELLAPASELLTAWGWHPDTGATGAAYWARRARWDKCVEIGPAATEPLICAMADPDHATRTRAAGALLDIGGDQVLEPLLEALPTLSWDVREAAIGILVSGGWEPDRSAAGATYWLLRGRSTHEVQAASEQCATIGAPAVETLISALREHDPKASPELRTTAAKALGDIGDPVAVEALIGVLEEQGPGPMLASSYISPDPRVQNEELRASAAHALGQIGDPVAADTLAAVMKDRDKGRALRQAAIMALGELGDPRAVGAMQRIFCVRDIHGEEHRDPAAQAAGSLDDTGATTGGAASAGEPDGSAGEATRTAISVGDIVVQYQHYEFAEPGTPGAALVNGPEPAFEGTVWRLKAIGATPGMPAPQGLSYSGSGAAEPIAELELVTGSYRHALVDESELPQDPQERMMMRWKGKTVSESGYTVQINNSPNYRDHYPDRDLLQQFYDEWKKAD